MPGPNSKGRNEFEVLSGLIWAGEKHRFSYLKINPFKEARKVVYSWGKDKNP